MELTRRNLAASAAVVLAAAQLIPSGPAQAEAATEAAVKDAVEAWRKAVLAQNKPALQQLAADQLSYGHSSGKVQNKAELIDGVMNRKAVIKSLSFPEMTVALAGDAAIVRHVYQSQSESGGKVNDVKLDVLSVWVQRGGDWKLLARQGYKPTTSAA